MTIARIAVLAFDGQQVLLQLPVGNHRVGREYGEVVLRDPNVSGTHARIEVTPGSVLVVDLGSANGTFDGSGNRLSAPYALAPGRPVFMGRSRLELIEAIAGGTRAMPEWSPPAHPPSTTPPTAMPQPPPPAPPQQALPRVLPVVSVVDELTDPRAGAGKLLALLGAILGLLGIALLLAARSKLADVGGLGMLVGGALLVGGLLQIGTGLVWRGRLNLMTKDPPNLPDGHQQLVGYLAERGLPKGTGQGFLDSFVYGRVENLGFAPPAIQALVGNMVSAGFMTSLYLLAALIVAVGLPEHGVLTPSRVVWILFFAIAGTWGFVPVGALRPRKMKTVGQWAFKTGLVLIAAILLPSAFVGMADVGVGVDIGSTYPLVWLLLELFVVFGVVALCSLQIRDVLKGFHVNTEVSQGTAELHAQVMPQQIYETLVRIMAEQRGPRAQPNRVYWQTDPARAAHGIAAQSDTRGNFDIEILQETPPSLSGPPSPLQGYAKLGYLVCLGCTAVGALWCCASVLWIATDSVLGVLVAVLPPVMAFHAAWILFRVFHLTCARVFFVSNLMHFRVRGTFEATFGRSVSADIMPWILAARIVTYSNLPLHSTRPTGYRSIASMYEAPEVLNALTEGLEQALHGQMQRKAVHLKVNEHLAEAVGRHAAQNVPLEQLLPNIPVMRRLSK